MYMKISWGAQLMAGVTLFVISFALETLVLRAYFDELSLAIGLAAALEVSKALSIVLYRFMKEYRDSTYPRSVTGLTLLFRLALFTLSLACSLMYLAEQLDRPNLHAVRQADLTQAEQRHRDKTAQFEAAHARKRETALEQARARDARVLQGIEAQYLPAIERLEAQLTREMDNVVNGAFAGPRYREIDRRLVQTRTEYNNRLSGLAQEQEHAMDELNARLSSDLGTALSAVEQERAQELGQIWASTYAGDERVQNPMVHSFLAVVNEVFGLHTNSLVFVFLFSSFVALLMELGIIVAFETLTLSHLPVFDAEHRVNMHLSKKRVETQGEMDAIRMDDAAERHKVERWVSRIVEGVRAKKEDAA